MLIKTDWLVLRELSTERLVEITTLSDTALESAVEAAVPALVAKLRAVESAPPAVAVERAAEIRTL
jgi:hypothetical protein